MGASCLFCFTQPDYSARSGMMYQSPFSRPDKPWKELLNYFASAVAGSSAAIE
jgi:hypothetical protein